MKFFEVVRFKVDERLLNAFNNAVTFISNIDDYTVSICVCVEIFSILHYEINNTRSILNKLMLIINELRNVHKKKKNKVCLKQSLLKILKKTNLFDKRNLKKFVVIFFQ